MKKIIISMFAMTIFLFLANKSFSKQNAPLIKTDTLTVYPQISYISRTLSNEYFECSKKKVLGNITDVEFALCIKTVAAKGYADASLKMSELHAEGKGVPLDPKLATEWLMKAATSGSSEAQHKLGLLEEQAKNIKMALYWYHQAAKNLNPNAISALSLLYYFGNGVPKNYREALQLMKYAVEFGLTENAGLVGQAYLEGIGTAKDNLQALAWFYVNTTKDPDYGKIIIKDKENLERKLSKQQIIKAQNLAANIQKKINYNTGLPSLLRNTVWIEDQTTNKSNTLTQATKIDLKTSEPEQTTTVELKPSKSRRKSFSFNTKDVAIIIGIEKYRSVPTTQFAANDAKLVREYFRAMGMPDRNIEFLIDERATYSDIRKVLETKLPNLVKSDSRVIVYYAGHGAPNPTDGTAYLVPYDGDPAYLRDTSYPIERMYESLSKLLAKEVLVVMDACFSGAGGRSVLPPGARGLVARPKNLPTNKLIVLASTQDNQITTSLPEQQHGLFTYFFLRALQEGKKDIVEVYNYLKPKVEDEAKRQNIEQSPTISPAVDTLNGRFAF